MEFGVEIGELWSSGQGARARAPTAAVQRPTPEGIVAGPTTANGPFETNRRAEASPRPGDRGRDIVR